MCRGDGKQPGAASRPVSYFETTLSHGADFFMALTVRGATPADADAISTLLKQLGYIVSGDRVVGYLANGEGGVLVAADDDGVVGFLGSHTRRHLHRDRLVTSIDSLVVDESCRSQGVGAALLEAICEQARSAGAAFVDLHSHQSRTEARRFYERHGFVVTSNYFLKEL